MKFENIKSEFARLKQLKQDLEVQFSNLQFLRQDYKDANQLLRGSELTRSINKNIQLSYSVDIQIMNFELYFSQFSDVILCQNDLIDQLTSLTTISMLFYDEYDEYQKMVHKVIHGDSVAA